MRRLETNMKAKKQNVPAVPSIEFAMDRVQAAADRSMLPQLPYADFVPGFGWVIDSVCNEGYMPTGGDRLIHQYQVMVVPSRFWS